MLCLAHALIWNSDVSIYGGFIRDYIINGVEPTDIDCGYYPSKTNINVLQGIISRTVNERQDLNLVADSLHQKGGTGFAWAITIREKASQFSFDIDLCDQEQMQTIQLHPGVDCDVGNFKLEKPGNYSFGIQLKVNNPHVKNFHQSLQNCNKKQFTFYYAPHYGTNRDICQRRLRKMIKKRVQTLKPRCLQR